MASAAANEITSATTKLRAVKSNAFSRFGCGFGQADGDTIVDFAGNGVGAGDWLKFVGYGSGATFTNIDAMHWQVNYNSGASHDIIAFSNGASIDVNDVLFA